MKSFSLKKPWTLFKANYAQDHLKLVKSILKKLSKFRIWSFFLAIAYLTYFCLLNWLYIRQIPQAILSQIPGLRQFVPPPPEILTFNSLVPDQPLNPMIEKEIGPEGGRVELANVAILDIPAGALKTNTRVKILQVLQVESTKRRNPALSFDVPEGEFLPGNDFITPIIRLEPFGLKLNKPALLYLSTDEKRVGNNDPQLIEKTASETAKNGDWYYSPYIEPLGSPDAPVPVTIQSPIKIRYFVYLSKQFPTNFGPDQGGKQSTSRLDLKTDYKKKSKELLERKHS